MGMLSLVGAHKRNTFVLLPANLLDFPRNNKYCTLYAALLEVHYNNPIRKPNWPHCIHLMSYQKPVDNLSLFDGIAIYI